jgi:2-methylisocitrate lyase-like PEP mutase family enzyme
VTDAHIDPARAKRAAFRSILERRGVTAMPGGFSPLYARMAQTIGFECFFIAGSQMSAYLLGVPDTGIIGLRDIADHVRHTAARCDIPILVDCDTGFGNAVNVHYTVQEIVRTGVAGLQIEDQEAPKKSGTSAGRRCIPLDEAVGKIRAAVAAKNALDPSFVICARCDTIGAEGMTIDDALERCVAYVRDGGADLVWLNSVQTREDLARICAAVPGPVLTIWGGPSPAPTLEEYERLGLRIALYPVIAAVAGMQAAWDVLNDFKARGTRALDDFYERSAASPWGKATFAQFVQLGEVRALEDAFLPEAQKRDYASTWGHDGQISSSKPGQSGILRGPQS